ncbi:MAG: SPOR domain-containing protein [Burkholderiaceae bacterium]
MLRLLVAALLVANLAFWAWHQPAVADWLGLPATQDGREPQRLQHQIHPEAIRLVGRGMPAGASAPAPAPATAPLPALAPSGPPAAASGDTAGAASGGAVPLCLEAGPLGDAPAATAAHELAQAGVPAGAWVDARRELPGRWVVYMGRYNDRDSLQRKLDELRHLDLAPVELRSPADLAPGLTLGEFGASGDAQARLDKLQARGVRTARVVQLPSPGAEHRLRADRVEPAAAEKLAALAAKSGATHWQTCSP